MTESKPAERHISRKEQTVLWSFVSFAGVIATLTTLFLIFVVGAYYTFTFFLAADPKVGPLSWIVLSILFCLFLLKINMDVLGQKSRALVLFQCCIAGLSVWVGLSTLFFGGPPAPRFLSADGAEWVILFLLGIVYGIAIFFQHRIELLVFRRFGERRFFAAFRVLAGIALLYSTFFLYWAAVLMTTGRLWGEEQGFIFYILIPLGIFISAIIGFANSMAYWRISPLLRRKTVSAQD